jgi:large subunit ribosomal protein L24
MENKKHSTKRFLPKFHVKKGDKVMVIAGSAKGSEGVITEVVANKNAAFVEGVNMIKKHVKPTNNSQGGIVEKEASINLSNLMLIDPKTGTPTKVGRKEVDGKSMRYSKKSGEIIK